jgi:hypothetical protein
MRCSARPWHRFDWRTRMLLLRMSRANICASYLCEHRLRPNCLSLSAHSPAHVRCFLCRESLQPNNFTLTRVAGADLPHPLVAVQCMRPSGVVPRWSVVAAYVHGRTSKQVRHRARAGCCLLLRAKQ